MNQTKSAVPYLFLLLGMLVLIPLANHEAKRSQELVIEVESKVVHLPAMALEQERNKK